MREPKLSSFCHHLPTAEPILNTGKSSPATTSSTTAATTASSSGATSSSTGTGGAMATAGSISGTITYTGTATGTLYVAAFKMFPPMGPPSGIATIASPTFPQAYSLTDIDPGDYSIFAYIDVGGNNTMQPGMEDPFALSTTKAMVTAGMNATQDVTIP